MTTLTLPTDIKERVRLAHAALSDSESQALEEGHAHLWTPLTNKHTVILQRNLKTKHYHLVVHGLDVQQFTTAELEQFLASEQTVDDFFAVNLTSPPAPEEETRHITNE